MRRFHIIFAAAAIVLPPAASAEVICSLGAARPSSYNPAVDERPSPDTMKIVLRVDAAYAPFCLPKCPEAAMFRNATAPNLMLAVYPDGAKMAYAPAFFSAVYGKYGEAGMIALLAHIYGHAIDETTPSNWIPTNWNRELRADAWAGCAVAKAGISANDLSGALGAMSAYPPPSQAVWSRRLPAVRLGFTHCGGEAAKFDAVSNGTKSK